MSHGTVIGTIPERNCLRFGEKARSQDTAELTAAGKDRGEHGSRQSAPGKEPDGASGGTAGPNHRPKGSDHQSQESGERLSSSGKQPDRLQGDASRPAHV